MKTVKEWSDAFDVLFNEVMSNASASLDEYDKSIFLTKGQEEVIKNYFNPKGNKYKRDLMIMPNVSLTLLLCLKWLHLQHLHHLTVSSMHVVMHISSLLTSSLLSMSSIKFQPTTRPILILSFLSVILNIIA